MSSSAANPTATAEPTKKVLLRTSDNEIFEVEESIAMEFGTVKSFLEDSPSSTNTVPLPNVSAQELPSVIEFCREHIKMRANADDDEEKKKRYNEGFVKEKSIGELAELLLVSNYLEIKNLLEVLNQAVADRIENKSVEYVRKFFGVENDYTPEEEAKLRQEYAWAHEGVDKD
ncbi:unnamed protein product [Dovyalis caffra]|uniref:SKP1-like protein n=1 Tax=Dovyalis caffra TaxID=77055 RepID=A0AAV1R4K5_9ROSI|nr:unnamed protein product [Dovyalis caffra]